MLEEALAALNAVYNELDAADVALCGVADRRPRRAMR